MANQADYTGLLHPIFTKEILNYLPDIAILQKEYPLGESTRVGRNFEEMVQLKAPQGFSLNGSAGALVTLNDPVAGLSAAAEIYPYEVTLREQVPYALFNRSGNGGDKAVKSAGAHVAKIMADSHRTRQEALHLKGQTGLFTVGAAISGQVITINDDTWSPAMAKALLGAQIDVWQAGFVTVRQANLVVSDIDYEAKTITVVGTGTGITTGDVIFFYEGCLGGDPNTFGEEIGLIKQVSTLTGTVFGISKTTNPVWRGNVVTSAGTFSKTAAIGWCKKINAKGYIGKLRAYLSSKAYGVLLGQDMSMRVLDSSYSTKKSEMGSDQMVVRLGQGSTLEFVEHPLMGEGQMLVLPAPHIKTVGSIPISFEIPGKEGQIFREVVIGKNGLEFQSNSDLQIFNKCPEGSLFVSGITF